MLEKNGYIEWIFLGTGQRWIYQKRLKNGFTIY